MEQVHKAEEELISAGIQVKSEMISDATKNGEGVRGMLEITQSSDKNGTNLFIQSILEETTCPSNWKGFGSLPTGKDGLEAVRIVNAIVESADKGEFVKIR